MLQILHSNTSHFAWLKIQASISIQLWRNIPKLHKWQDCTAYHARAKMTMLPPRRILLSWTATEYCVTPNVPQKLLIVCDGYFCPSDSFGAMSLLSKVTQHSQSINTQTAQWGTQNCHFLASSSAFSFDPACQRLPSLLCLGLGLCLGFDSWKPQSPEPQTPCSCRRHAKVAHCLLKPSYIMCCVYFKQNANPGLMQQGIQWENNFLLLYL